MALLACAGPVAAENGTEQVTFELSITSDGTPQSIGIPGPTNASLASIFPNGTSGVTAIFAYEEGDWQLVTNLEREVEPLEAFAMGTDTGGPSSVPVRVSVHRHTPAESAIQEEGWTFTAGRVARPPTEAFGAAASLVVSPFGTPDGPDTHPDTTFEYHIPGSTDWNGESPILDPFGGYFVHSNATTPLPTAIDDAENASEAKAQLGMATLEGTVETDPEVGDPTGIDLQLRDGDTVVAEPALAEDGSYSVTGLRDKHYDIEAAAPGFGPNANGTTEAVTLSRGYQTQNLSVEWLAETNLYVDGGAVTLPGGAGSGLPAAELPGCTQQPDGTWEPDPIELNDTNQSVDIAFDPANECYRLDNVGINATTGTLDVDAENDTTFPTIIIETDQLEGIDFAESLEFEVEFLIDELTGTADLRTGEAEIDLEMRLLIGGTVTTAIFPVDFGARGGNMDCQLAAAWGGNVSDPQPDDAGEQIGEYRHDPLELALTTGTSGNATGRPYDGTNGSATVAEGLVTAGRLSEGQYGADDPGGASCGAIGLGIDIDIASVINDMLGLPSEPGDMAFELTIKAGDDTVSHPIP